MKSHVVAAAAAFIFASVAPAEANSYFEALHDLDGRTYDVKAHCPPAGEDPYSINFEDPDDEYTYFYLYEPDEPSDDWEQLAATCAEGGDVTIGIAFAVDYGTDPTIHFVGLSEADDALTMAELGEEFTTVFANVDSIEGWLDTTNQDLTYAMVREADAEYGKYVYFSSMPPRTTIDFLNTCFETCEYGRFTLADNYVTLGGFSVMLYASGWEAIDPPQAPRDHGDDRRNDKN